MLLGNGDKIYDLECKIVKGKKTSILGLKASIILGLVSGLHKVDKEGFLHNVEDNYNELILTEIVCNCCYTSILMFCNVKVKYVKKNGFVKGDEHTSVKSVR